MSLRSFLNLDFSRMAKLSGANYSTDTDRLDALLTYSRASVGTRRNASKQLESMASGVPRFNLASDDLTFGLKVEPARTNYIANSSDLSGFNAYGATIGGATASDIGGYAYKLQEDSSSSFHFVGLNSAGTVPTANSVCALSVYAKAVERRYLQLVLDNGITTVGTWANFDLVAGTKTAGAGYGSLTNSQSYIEYVGGGWYRCTVVTNIGAGITVPRAGFMSLASGTEGLFAGHAGTTGNGMYLQAPQFEVGGCSTSWIPTTSGAAGRAADSAITAAMSPWFNPLAGTWLIDAYAQPILGIDMVFLDGPANYRHLFYKRGDNGKSRAAFVTAGGFQADFTSASVWNGRGKTALSYDANGCSFCFTGESVQTSSNANVPAPSQISIGLSQDGAYSHGDVYRVNYLPYKISDQQMKQAVLL